jgi:hypothetical protein
MFERLKVCVLPTHLPLNIDKASVKKGAFERIKIPFYRRVAQTAAYFSGETAEGSGLDWG